MSSARAENGVDQKVLAVSSINKKNSSQQNIIVCELFGILHKSTLQMAIKKIATNINFKRLPKRPFFALSEIFPTSGSLIPSQSEDMPMAMPTSVPESPMIEVQKNIKKEPIV